MARQVERWTRQYRASQTETIDDMERLIAWLPAHLPPPRRCGWCTATTASTTSSWRRSRPAILAVLDWELSTLGDPLADFTYHLMAWDMPPSPTGAGFGTLAGRDLAALGIPVARRQSSRPIGRAPGSIRAASCRSISPTISSAWPRSCRASPGGVRDGTAASENAAGMAAMVRPLAAKAWEFAQEAGAR